MYTLAAIYSIPFFELWSFILLNFDYPLLFSLTQQKKSVEGYFVVFTKLGFQKNKVIHSSIHSIEMFFSAFMLSAIFLFVMQACVSVSVVLVTSPHEYSEEWSIVGTVSHKIIC